MMNTVFPIILNGNFNTELGQVEYSRTVSLFILDGVNERGKKLLQLCTEKKLVVSNTRFQTYREDIMQDKN